MNYYCEHNICPMLTNLPEHTDTVVVNHNVSFASIAKFCDIDISLLRDLDHPHAIGISQQIPGTAG